MGIFEGSVCPKVRAAGASGDRVSTGKPATSPLQLNPGSGPYLRPVQWLTETAWLPHGVCASTPDPYRAGLPATPLSPLAP